MTNDEQTTATDPEQVAVQASSVQGISFAVVLLQPNACTSRTIGRILTRFEEKGFRLLRTRITLLSRAQIAIMYPAYVNTPRFDQLVAYLQSSPVTAVVLYYNGSDAVAVANRLVGNAYLPGTIRGDFDSDASHSVIYTTDTERDMLQAAEVLFGQEMQVILAATTDALADVDMSGSNNATDYDKLEQALATAENTISAVLQRCQSA